MYGYSLIASGCGGNGKGNTPQFIERKSNDALIVISWVQFTSAGEYLSANIADSAIFAGVAILLIMGLRSEDEART